MASCPRLMFIFLRFCCSFFCAFTCSVTSAAVTLGQIAITVAAVGPRDVFTATSLIQSAPSCTFGNLSPLVLGDHPLHLCEQLALRGIAEWVLKKDQLCIEFLELLYEKPLMRVVE